MFRNTINFCSYLLLQNKQMQNIEGKPITIGEKTIIFVQKVSQF